VYKTFHSLNSSKLAVKRVSPGATVMKYNQSPGIGSSAALIAAEPGLQIGPGGKPYFR
jgi:hypothetical protein